MIATNHSKGSFQSCTCRLGYVEYFVGIMIKMTCCWIGWQWCSWGCLLLFHFVLVIAFREGIRVRPLYPLTVRAVPIWARQTYTGVPCEKAAKNMVTPQSLQNRAEELYQDSLTFFPTNLRDDQLERELRLRAYDEAKKEQNQSSFVTATGLANVAQAMSQLPSGLASQA